MFAALMFAFVFIVAADPTPTPAPVVPEIGRVRASAPACSVLSGLVAPSFTAAQNADQRFDEAALQLPKYAHVMNDPFERFGVQRDAMLSRLDSTLTSMQADARSIARAIADPRLVKTSTDSDIVSERAQLEQLYAAQMARINVLSEFVTRQRIAIMRHDPTVPAVDARVTPASPGPNQEGRAPEFTQPRLQGIETNDREQFADWSLGMTAAMRRSEARAAQVIGSIAAACR